MNSGVGDGQGGLACYDSWSREESDMTERLIRSDLIISKIMQHGMYSLFEDSTECMNCVHPMVFKKIFVGGFP